MPNLIDFTLVESFFHISPQGAARPLLELPATDFHNREVAHHTLVRAGEMVQATSIQLAASFVGISFFNLCITNLIFAAQYNRFLDLSLQNLTYQLESHDDHAHLGFKINELRWVDVPLAQDERKAFLEEAFSSSFRNEINAIVEAVALGADVKSGMIWSQVGGHINEVHHYVVHNIKHPALVEAFERDLNVLLGLAPDVFNRKRNPFVHKPRYIDNPWAPEGGQLMMRSSCCMYDCKVDGQKCYTCPRMLPDEREERRKLALAGAH
ncbi:IucA/IucC family C-terminal-domain containing protein [Paenibacillus sinopodophylli]|uniref:IucA/IucC family C-terminal-domain containing protein n=1 Tax=Paenibacillus sinopodophylli TaxID=1837342 RepID=UPI00110CE97E|nr:IucA/IucC family C-terminal-domain containing protein [Paenibacillus sinopodophylli]